ncbi:MAG: hypothetical protein DRN29_10110, partial [Thermoplasmata archaeon]
MLFTLVMGTLLGCYVFSLLGFISVSSKPWGVSGFQARSGFFNLSLGVAVSGELSGQNPEDWYYLGPLGFAAYNFSLTTDSARSDFRIVLKAWCPMCPGEASMVEPAPPIDNFGTGFNESGLFVPPSFHLRVEPEFVVKVEDKNRVGGRYTLLVERVADAILLEANQPAVFHDFGPGSHLLFSFHPSSGGLFNVSLCWSDPNTSLAINGMALSSSFAYESSGGSTWALFYLEDGDRMDVHVFHRAGTTTNTGSLIFRPVELETLAGSVNGFLNASDPSCTVRCYLCSVPPGAYYDFNLSVGGGLDAGLSVHGNVYVFNTTLWNIGMSDSGGAGGDESVLDLVACQGLSYAMGERGSKFQFTMPENGTVVNTEHVIVAVRARSGSGRFTLTLSREEMPRFEEGVTHNASFNLLSGRRYAFWSFTGRPHALYTANVSYTVHN